MINHFPPIAVGLLAVFDPDKGGGLPQTIIGIVVLIGAFILAIRGSVLPSWVSMMIGGLIVYFYRNEAKTNMIPPAQ